MANVINMGGGGANVQSKTVKSTTAKQTLTPPSGVDGFSPVIISPMVLQEKTVSLSTSQQVLTPPSGVDGFSKITIPGENRVRYTYGYANVLSVSNTIAISSLSVSFSELLSVMVVYDWGLVADGQVQAVVWGRDVTWQSEYHGLAFCGVSSSSTIVPVYCTLENGNIYITLASSSLVFKAQTDYRYVICGVQST